MKKDSLKAAGKTDFIPEWIENVSHHKSFRSIFKWGAKDEFKKPGQGFFNVIKQELGLSDDDFQRPAKIGSSVVENSCITAMSSEDIILFENIVARENCFIDTYERLKYSTGKAMEDIFNLREEKIENISDIVLHPRSKEDVQEILKLCHEKRIPLHVYGGGSSVTLGLTCPKGGVTLVMNTHMNKIVKFSEINRTISVEAGMMGPVYEDLLNNAPEKQFFTNGRNQSYYQQI